MSCGPCRGVVVCPLQGGYVWGIVVMLLIVVGKFCVVIVCGVLFGFECLFDFVCVVSCVFPRVIGSCVICCFKRLIRVICISLEVRCW